VHCDNIQATGYSGAYQLPNYVDFSVGNWKLVRLSSRAEGCGGGNVGPPGLVLGGCGMSDYTLPIWTSRTKR